MLTVQAYDENSLVFGEAVLCNSEDAAAQAIDQFYLDGAASIEVANSYGRVIQEINFNSLYEDAA